MIFDSDFDTLLPCLDDLDEHEEWSVETAVGEHSSPAPGKMISCFNALAVLSLSFFLSSFSAELRGLIFVQWAYLEESCSHCSRSNHQWTERLKLRSWKRLWISGILTCQTTCNTT